MAITEPTNCPECQVALTLPAGAAPGRKLRCPGCRHVFALPGRADADTLSAAAASSAVPDNRAAAETRDGDEVYGLINHDGNPAPLGMVGRFQLRRFLGQGAFGRVYLANDPQLERLVALKVPREKPADRRGVRRFLSEATAAAQLQHPNIVAIYEAGEADDALFIASAFVEGQPLSLRLSEKPPSERQAVRWVRDLARALDYAHELRVIHRDIKPANIMVGRKDRVQVMDFGLAVRIGIDPTTGTTVVGTPAYMSPEQARGDQPMVGPASDQYALGVILYEMLTGITPFRGTVPQILKQVGDSSLAAVSPRRLKPAIPAALALICLKALEKVPTERYRSCNDFAADLQRWLDGKQVLVDEKPIRINVFARSISWAKIHRRISLAVLLVLLLVTIGVVVGVRGYLRLEVADQRVAEARRENLIREADLYLERGQRLNHAGQPGDGLVWLARAYEISVELADNRRERESLDALAALRGDLPTPPSAVAGDWKLAGGLMLGLPVSGEVQATTLAHAGLARFTGYGGEGGNMVLTADQPLEHQIETKGPRGQKGFTTRIDPLILRDASTGTSFGEPLGNSGSILFSPDGKRIVWNNRMTWGLLAADTGEPIKSPHEKDQPDRRLAFSPNGTKLVAFGDRLIDRGSESSAGVEVWNPLKPDIKPVRTSILDQQRPRFIEVAIRDDGRGLGFIEGSQNQAWFWPVEEREGSKLGREGVKSLGISFVPGSPDIAVVTEKSVELWSARGEFRRDWLAIGGRLSFTFSPDGRHVATVGNSGVRLWNITTGAPLGPPRHPGADRVQFRPDGRQLLTAADHDCRLWPHQVISLTNRVQAVKLWAEATAGKQVMDGTLQPLSEADRRDRAASFKMLTE